MPTKQMLVALLTLFVCPHLLSRCRNRKRQGDLQGHTCQAKDHRHVQGAQLRQAACTPIDNRNSGRRAQ